MEVSRLLEFYWQALLPSVNRLEKTLPRLLGPMETSISHHFSGKKGCTEMSATMPYMLIVPGMPSLALSSVPAAGQIVRPIGPVCWKVIGR